MVWYSHLLKNFPQFIVIHTVQGFGIVNKAEIDVFLELSCFFDDLVDVGNLISGSFAFSKTSLNIWKFMVHVLLKPGLENFEDSFISMWDKRNCAVIWAFFGKIYAAAAAAAKSLQSCTNLCDPIDGSPPGSPVPGFLQARTLEWVAISFSSAWKWKVKVKLLSRVWLLATPWTAAYQTPPSMGFSRQEYWSGVLLPSPGRPIGTTKKI